MHGFLHYCGQIINRFFHKSIFEPGTVSLFFQRKLIIVEWPCFIHTNVVRNSKGLCKSPLLKTNIVLGELLLFFPKERERERKEVNQVKGIRFSGRKKDGCV